MGKKSAWFPTAARWRLLSWTRRMCKVAKSNRDCSNACLESPGSGITWSSGSRPGSRCRKPNSRCLGQSSTAEFPGWLPWSRIVGSFLFIILFIGPGNNDFNNKSGNQFSLSSQKKLIGRILQCFEYRKPKSHFKENPKTPGRAPLIEPAGPLIPQNYFPAILSPFVFFRPAQALHLRLYHINGVIQEYTYEPPSAPCHKTREFILMPMIFSFPKVVLTHHLLIPLESYPQIWPNFYHSRDKAAVKTIEAFCFPDPTWAVDNIAVLWCVRHSIVDQFNFDGLEWSRDYSCFEHSC